MSWAHAILLAVVEGFTEYLPVSSTGHIILTSWLLGINQESFVKDYTVMVQFGAILSVVLLYWKRLVLNVKLYPRVIAAFLPAAVIGLAFKKHIEAMIGSVEVVAWSLLIGGVLLILTDHWVRRLKHDVRALEDLGLPAAVKIGLFQCLAMIPGTSRSAATIWGGLFVGLSLPLATEFSFFLAVPTLTGAGALELRKVWPTVTADQASMLIVGNLVSFVVGALAVRGFVRLVSRYGLRWFGYYRVVIGAAVLIALSRGARIQLVE